MLSIFVLVTSVIHAMLAIYGRTFWLQLRDGRLRSVSLAVSVITSIFNLMYQECWKLNRIDDSRRADRLVGGLGVARAGILSPSSTDKHASAESQIEFKL